MHFTDLLPYPSSPQFQFLHIQKSLCCNRVDLKQCWGKTLHCGGWRVPQWMLLWVLGTHSSLPVYQISTVSCTRHKRLNNINEIETEKQTNNTSLPRRSLTKMATWAKSRFKATKPLFPRFPNNMSGFTTSLDEESHGSLSASSLRSVDSVTYSVPQNKPTFKLPIFGFNHSQMSIK